MKHLALIISMVLSVGTLQAQYRAAEIVMANGDRLEGMAEVPDFGDNNVSFKASEGDRAQKIKSKEIKTIVFRDGAAPTEMDYLNCKMQETIVAAVGWGWLTVVSRGAVSIYTGKKPPVAGQTYRNNEDIMYCYKEGEKHAISPPILTFAATMSKYLEDYPELSAKIKHKSDGYRYENMEAIIAEYNEWKGN